MKKILLFIFLFATASFIALPAKAQDANTPVQTNFESEKETEISISVFNNTLYVINAAENSYLEIRNMLGEKVFESYINSDKEEFYLNLKKGFYIIKIGDILQRIIIK